MMSKTVAIAMVLYFPILGYAQKQKPIKGFTQYQVDHYDINGGDPDTALAVFLWKYCSQHPNYSNHGEEYFRWDLEHKKISKLIAILFKNYLHYQQKIEILEKNRKGTILFARQTVWESYKKYNSVSDQIEFEYLINRRDSLVIPLIEEMLANSHVDSYEKKALAPIYESIRKNK